MAEAGPTVDSSGLESYLQAELAERLVEPIPLHDGINEIVALATTKGDRRYVLRRPTKLWKTALAQRGSDRVSGIKTPPRNDRSSADASEVL